MKFCSTCGGPLERAIPQGDDRPRAVCPRCGAIHYENPRTVVGCIVEHGERLLLCRRAIEPRRGDWTVPAGFLELDEGTSEGAARETWEEARARVDVYAPYATFDLPIIGQVYTLFRARLDAPEFEAGPESLEVELFDLDAIPWGELAFPVVHHALELYVADREAGVSRVHHGILRWRGEGSRFDAGSYQLESHITASLGDA